jgi:pimeloyl-ACP methyl ester carboxylesterase
MTTQPEGGFPTQAELEARYCLVGSRFAEVNGVRLHYVDEGAGPAILLLHGSYASLRQWDDWAAGLRDRYRVIRFDFPAYGLSAPAPDGDYGAAAKCALITALLDRLRTGRVLLVATSSAGVPGAAFAAADPARLTGLILNNIGVGPVRHDTPPSPAFAAALAEDATHPGWHREAFWRQILLANYADPARLSDAVVTRWTELNNRQFPGATLPDPDATAAEFARTIDDLPRVTVPTLVLWSDRDPEVPLEREGRRAFDLLGAADKSLAIVPDAGHMMPEECGERGLEVALPFITRVTGSTA